MSDPTSRDYVAGSDAGGDAGGDAGMMGSRVEAPAHSPEQVNQHFWSAVYAGLAALAHADYWMALTHLEATLGWMERDTALAAVVDPQVTAGVRSLTESGVRLDVSVSPDLTAAYHTLVVRYVSLRAATSEQSERLPRASGIERETLVLLDEVMRVRPRVDEVISWRSCSLVLPAYNEEEIIAVTVRNCIEAMRRFCPNCEVIVVDDGSADQTGRIADDLAGRDAAVIALHNRPNRGYGGALRRGFAAARGEWVFVMDSDGQFDITEIQRLLRVGEQEPEAAVLGYRAKRSDPPMRLLNAWGWKLATRALIGLYGIHDIDCAFKLLPARAIRAADITSQGAAVSAEFLTKFRLMQVRIVQLPVGHYPRRTGSPTGAKLSVILRAFAELFTLRRRLRTWRPAVEGFSVRPAAQVDRRGARSGAAALAGSDMATLPRIPQSVPEAEPEAELEAGVAPGGLPGAARVALNGLADQVAGLLAAWRALPAMDYVALAVICALGFFLRLYDLGAIPAGIHIDEADAAYDAYALLQNGTDKWGNHLPVYLPGWGSGQNALLSYLEVPVIKLLGLNAISVRLVPVTLACLTLPLLYVVVRRVYGRLVALLATLILAIIPWHVMMSRWGLESNLQPFFLLLGVALFTLATDERNERFARWLLPIAFVPFALALYAYGIAVVMAPLLVGLLVVASRRMLLRHWVASAVGLIACGVVATPFGMFMLVNYVLHREPSQFAALPFSAPLLPGSRLQQVTSGDTIYHIFRVNITYLTSGFNDGLPGNVLAGYLPLGLSIAPLAVAGIAFSLRYVALSRQVFLLWLLSTTPLLFASPLNVNRDNAAYIPLIALSAVAIVGIVRAMPDRWLRTMLAVALVGVIVGYSLAFTRDYFRSENRMSAETFLPTMGVALTEAQRLATPGEPIYVSNKGRPPLSLDYIYVLYYDRVNVTDFQRTVRYTVVNGAYQVNSFDRYAFVPDSPLLTSAPSYVFVAPTDETLTCKQKTIVWSDSSLMVGQCVNR